MNMVRKVIESTYIDTCSIVESQKEKVKGVVKLKDVTVIENQPCKLSFESIRAAENTETATAITQGVKLFVAPEIEIKSGSKIIVEHCGRTLEYERSGIPAVYNTHQEIKLEPHNGWS